MAQLLYIHTVEYIVLCTKYCSMGNLIMTMNNAPIDRTCTASRAAKAIQGIVIIMPEDMGYIDPNRAMESLTCQVLCVIYH